MGQSLSALLRETYLSKLTQTKCPQSLKSTKATAHQKSYAALRWQCYFFLAEIEDDNAIEYCKSFIYNSSLFDFANHPHKLKGIFFDPLGSRREVTTSKSILFAFRAFVFHLRSDPQYAAPSEWSLADVAELGVLNDIITIEVVFFDAI